MKKLIGVCRTHFFNACDRAEKLESQKRPCYVAYVGHGRTFQSKRFPIDTLGQQEALELAKEWRAKRAPTDARTCDIARREKSKCKPFSRTRTSTKARPRSITSGSASKG
jgi:hypothetical protein